MNEAKHTPGPWAHINPDGFTVRHPQVYSDTGPVCNATWLGDVRIDELRANARLIAAAPELLEALQSSEKKIVAMFDAISRGSGEDFSKNDPDVLKIRAAIAKATVATGATA